jgi:endonuclease-8
MSGSWSVVSSATAPHGTPWLVLRGSEHQAVLRGGPVLELHTRALARLGPDILANPPDVERMLDRLARAEGQRTLGETLQDQSLVAGIGNMWMAEALWLAELSPWSRLADVDPAGRRAALESAAELMHAALEGGRERARQVYGRVGRPCRRCGTPIRAFGQGDAHRTAYWCPGCQVGAGLPTREPARPAGS